MLVFLQVEGSAWNKAHTWDTSAELLKLFSNSGRTIELSYCSGRRRVRHPVQGIEDEKLVHLSL